MQMEYSVSVASCPLTVPWRRVWLYPLSTFPSASCRQWQDLPLAFS